MSAGRRGLIATPQPCEVAVGPYQRRLGVGPAISFIAARGRAVEGVVLDLPKRRGVASRDERKAPISQ